MIKEGGDNGGQVTIFIVVGLVIVLSMILFFVIFATDIVVKNPPSKVPRNFVEQCIAGSLSPSLKAVLDYGGSIQPATYIMKNDHMYHYLCYAEEYYTRCYNYYPMLNAHAEEQILTDSFSRVDECFDFLVEDYESRGFDVESEALDYKVQIVPGSIRLKIRKPIAATKGDVSENFEEFDTSIPSDLYDLISFTRSIINQEAEFCYFENNGFMMMYPKYNLTRFDLVETKIYDLQNRQTKETFKFAIRSCAYAPGF